jgi:hypothetical protein
MDLLWPILGGTVLATAGAIAGIWTLEGAIGLTGNAGLGVAALAAVALKMALRLKDIAGLRGELTDVRRTLDQADTDCALARGCMMAVHQALADVGCAKRPIKAMVDEMAIM